MIYCIPCICRHCRQTTIVNSVNVKNPLISDFLFFFVFFCFWRRRRTTTTTTTTTPTTTKNLTRDKNTSLRFWHGDLLWFCWRFWLYSCNWFCHLRRWMLRLPLITSTLADDSMNFCNVSPPDKAVALVFILGNHTNWILNDTNICIENQNPQQRILDNWLVAKPPKNAHRSCHLSFHTTSCVTRLFSLCHASEVFWLRKVLQQNIVCKKRSENLPPYLVQQFRMSPPIKWPV